MTGIAIEGPVQRAIASGGAMLDVVSSVDPWSFASAMADVDLGHARRLALEVHAPVLPAGEPAPVLASLARQLDEIARHRVEARARSEELAGAWASGVDTPALAVSMHRQARAMASYNLGVMWGAKLIGATTAALRQLVTAT